MQGTSLRGFRLTVAFKYSFLKDFSLITWPALLSFRHIGQFYSLTVLAVRRGQETSSGKWLQVECVCLTPKHCRFASGQMLSLLLLHQLRRPLVPDGTALGWWHFSTADHWTAIWKAFSLDSCPDPQQTFCKQEINHWDLWDYLFM